YPCNLVITEQSSDVTWSIILQLDFIFLAPFVMFILLLRPNPTLFPYTPLFRSWHYARELPEGTSPSVKRNISIYGDRIYAATSDGTVVALDARTGNVVWNQRIDGNPRLTGGPLVARGVVMQGTDGRRPGGGFVQ